MTQESEVVTQEIVANVDKTVDMKEFEFRFNKDKMSNKRANVKLTAPVPSVEGLIDIIQKGGKDLELVLDGMYDTIRSVMSEIVSAKEDASQENFPFAEVTWSKIANMTKEDRRSSAIPSEVWEAFCKDYIAVMPGLTGKSVEAVTNATVVYVKKFAPWKTDKKTINLLKAQLALYAETANAEQFEPILTLLVRRADAYLGADDLTMVASNL